MSAGEHLVQALLETVRHDPALGRALAEGLAPHLPRAELEPGGWLDTAAAARYLGFRKPDALHKLVAARAIRFSQTEPGAKCYFERADLDEYRRRHLHGRP